MLGESGAVHHGNGVSHSGESVGLKRATLIEKEKLRIVITDAPSNFNMEQHLRELLALNVRHVVRACEPSYDTAALVSAGIQVHDLQFPDGAPPSDTVRKEWLDLVENCFLRNAIEPSERLSVHCIAGLGRAPVLVAIALIEFCGMEPVDAVQLIRSSRRGAINMRQFQYLESYVPTRKPSSCTSCAIM